MNSLNLLMAPDNKSYSPYLLHGPREERTLNICLPPPRMATGETGELWSDCSITSRLPPSLSSQARHPPQKPGEPFNKIRLCFWRLAATYHHVPTEVLSGSGQICYGIERPYFILQRVNSLRRLPSPPSNNITFSFDRHNGLSFE